MTTVVPY